MLTVFYNEIKKVFITIIDDNKKPIIYSQVASNSTFGYINTKHMQI